MLSVVCYRWTPPAGYRSVFPPETVNVLRRMVARHYLHPHRFLCVTDDAHGLDNAVEVVPIWEDLQDLRSPHGGNNPSCYRRLRAFDPAIAALFGPRFVTVDLDCVIVGDLTPLWHRPEDFVMWGDTNPLPGSHYNGSMLLMTAGARRQVWERFDPMTSPQAALRARCWGSDQGWISYCLGPDEARWTKADGVYSFRNDLHGRATLPDNARIVFWHGKVDPWSPAGQALPWVRAHWC